MALHERGLRFAATEAGAPYTPLRIAGMIRGRVLCGEHRADTTSARSSSARLVEPREQRRVDRTRRGRSPRRRRYRAGAEVGVDSAPASHRRRARDS